MRARDEGMSAAVAAAVLAVGENHFGDAVLHAVQRLAGADLCSAFRIWPGGAPEHLCSAGDHQRIPRFAEVASLGYASVYWRRDTLALSMKNRAGRGDDVHVFRQAWNGIKDPEYRHDCYERAAVVERITMFRSGPLSVCLSAYRTEAKGLSTAADVERLEAHASILTAAVAKHAAIRSAQTCAPVSESDVLVALLKRGDGLSTREAEVAAALIAGKTQAEIAEETGIALNSVITYRKRAYGKLGVGDRRELKSLFHATGDLH